MKMQQFHINRLWKLANYLMKVKKSTFDMEYWITACGTKACACGHACKIASFRRAGLRLENSDYSNEYLDLKYKGNTNFGAAANFFGLSMNDSLDLFSTTLYEETQNPKLVAKHIRVTVKLLAALYELRVPQPKPKGGVSATAQVR